jgi:transcriptional regulator with XRE-family HTH domain
MHRCSGTDLIVANLESERLLSTSEAGERNPSLENIARLAVALGVDAADLVKGFQRVNGRGMIAHHEKPQPPPRSLRITHGGI